MPKCLDVHTIQGSPLAELLNSLKGVWCPTILDNASITDKLPPRVKQLLAELESTLSSTVRTDKSNSSSNSSSDVENTSDISEPVDEVNFWLKVKDDRRSPYKVLAREVDKLLIEIAPFSDLNNMELRKVSDLVEKSLDALNGIWSLPLEDTDRQVYPQKRMAHLFDCIGSTLCRYIQTQLSAIDIWKPMSNEVRQKMRACINIFEQWCEVPKRLTTTYWPGLGSHPWKGHCHEDTFTASFKLRLDQVLSILTLSDELSMLLTSAEKATFQLDKLFDPLRDTKPIMYNPYTEPQWQRAVREYERLVDPVESAVASKLRKSVSDFLDKPTILLSQFQRGN